MMFYRPTPSQLVFVSSIDTRSKVVGTHRLETIWQTTFIDNAVLTFPTLSSDDDVTTSLVPYSDEHRCDFIADGNTEINVPNDIVL